MFIKSKKYNINFNKKTFLLSLLLSTPAFSSEGLSSRYDCSPEIVPKYKAVITEEDILENDVVDEITEEDIFQAIDLTEKSLKIPANAPILLIQAGRKEPNILLQKQLAKHYMISVFDGFKKKKPVYVKEEEPQGNYIKSLRLMAAKGGQTHIIIAWDKLESGKVNKDEINVNWKVCENGTLPSTTQFLRYKLHFIVINVKTGQWSMFNPVFYEESLYEKPYKKGSIIAAEQVEALKKEMIDYVAAGLFERYSGIKSTREQKVNETSLDMLTKMREEDAKKKKHSGLFYFFHKKSAEKTSDAVNQPRVIEPKKRRYRAEDRIIPVEFVTDDDGKVIDENVAEDITPK